MKYRVYFISRNFHKIMTKDLLTILLEKEKTEFKSTQMRQILNFVMYGELFGKARAYFKFREDMIIDDFSLSTSSAFLNYSSLFVEDGELYFEKNDDYSPISEFLQAYYPTYILIPESKVKNY